MKKLIAMVTVLVLLPTLALCASMGSTYASLLESALKSDDATTKIAYLEDTKQYEVRFTTSGFDMLFENNMGSMVTDMASQLYDGMKTAVDAVDADNGGVILHYVSENDLSKVYYTYPEDGASSAVDSVVKRTTTADSGATMGEKNALNTAHDYLNYTAFSYTGLIGQLEYEGYSTSEATYAADHCGADWNEQAKKCAANYLDYTSFSRSGLIDQLEYEGFTRDQAEYGVSQNGY